MPQPAAGNIFALGSTDFTGGEYTFTMQPDEQQISVQIPILDDEVVEELRERFSVSLSVLPQPGINLGNNRSDVTITDDDGMSDVTLLSHATVQFAHLYCRYCH